MSERIIGYSLLVLGIITMIFATIQIIFVFTGKVQPIGVFQYEETSKANIHSKGFFEQLQNSVNTQGLNMNDVPNLQLIDPNVLNKMLNLTLYYFIMQFLLGLGYKFSSLGTQLIRPIQVKMKNRSLERDKNNNSEVS